MALFGINKKVSWKNHHRNNDPEKENKEFFVLLLFKKEKNTYFVVKVHDILGSFFIFQCTYNSL